MLKSTLQKRFTSLSPLQTPRLILRRIQISDAKDMFSYSAREDVTRYLLWSPHPDLFYTEGYVRYLQERYDVGDFFDFAIQEKASGRMIGTCGFTDISPEHGSCEIGYVLHPAYWGRGYATEALGAILSFAGELGLHRVEARLLPQNTASIRVVEKNGFIKEGILREAILCKGVFCDVAIYGKLLDQ